MRKSERRRQVGWREERKKRKVQYRRVIERVKGEEGWRGTGSASAKKK